MTLVLLESFDYGRTSAMEIFNVGALWHKWPRNDDATSTGTAVLLTSGRTGRCLHLGASDRFGLVMVHEDPLMWDDLYIFGFAWKGGMSYVPVGGPRIDLMGFKADGTLVSHCYLRSGPTNGAGSIAVCRSATDTLLHETGAGVVPTDTTTWCYIEIKIRCHASAGTIEIHVNGIEVANVSGKNTSSDTSGINKFAGIKVDRGSNGGNNQMDDVYVCNEQGTENNDFLGDVQVHIGEVDGATAGASSQWTPLGQTTNQNCVDDDILAPESNVANMNDFVRATSSGLKDLYVPQSGHGTFENIGDDAQVLGAVVSVWGSKTDVGTRRLSGIIKVGGTEYTGTALDMQEVFVDSGGTPTNGRGTPLPVDAPGAGWTGAAVKAGQFGMTS
jgi:hypothetical protein